MKLRFENTSGPMFFSAVPAPVEETQGSPSELCEAISTIGHRAAPWLGGSAALALVAGYMLLIHNRFLPIHEGWFALYGRLMQQGKLPYRDFFFFTQPMSLFIGRALLNLSDKVIYTRYYGMVERCLLYALLYYILSRRFSAVASCIATVTSGVFLITYYTDVFFSYLYTCLLFLLAAAACLQAAHLFPLRRRVLIILTGCFASLAFFAKQSTGLFGCMAIVVSIVLLNHDLRQTRRDLLWATAGGVVAALPFLGWILSNGLWSLYLDQVYRGAAASKGSFATICLGFLRRFVEPLSADTMIILLMVAGWLIYERRVFLVEPSFERRPVHRIVFYSAGAALAVFLPFAFRLSWVQVYRVSELSMYFVRLNVYWIVALLLWVLWRRWSGTGLTGRADETVVILGVLAVFWAYGCAASFAIEHNSVIPSMSLLLAFSYDRIRFRRPDTMRRIVIAVSLVLLTVSVTQKYSLAYTWIGWGELVSQHPTHSRWKLLDDYGPEQSGTQVYDTILDDIASHSTQGDTVFTFPAMPMFNYVSGRNQPTFCQVHYWDVCPDWLATADAQRVKEARPRLIVNMDSPEVIWKYHEKIFRTNARSGQRDIQRAIDDLVASGDYELLHEFNSASFEYPIYVWWRRK